MNKTIRILAQIMALVLLLACMPAMAATGDIPVDAAHFPDANFRSFVADNFDKNHDGVLTSAERNKVTKIDIWYDDEIDNSYSSLKGLEYFPKLKSLSIEAVSGTVDLSKNTALTSVALEYGSLTSLNVSNNKNLEYLAVSYNNLTRLDVSNNKKLTRLYVRGNALTSLNVKKNTKLKYLDVGDNKLTSLIVSKNKNLVWLDCARNSLTKLDVSKNTRLTQLVCHNNKLSKLDLRKNKSLTGLAAFGNPKLKKLDIAKCKKLQNAIKKYSKKTISGEGDPYVCWGKYYEAELLRGVCVSPGTKVTAGKKVLYAGK